MSAASTGWPIAAMPAVARSTSITASPTRPTRERAIALVDACEMGANLVADSLVLLTGIGELLEGVSEAPQHCVEVAAIVQGDRRRPFLVGVAGKPFRLLQLHPRRRVAAALDLEQTKVREKPGLGGHVTGRGEPFQGALVLPGGSVERTEPMQEQAALHDQPRRGRRR